MVHSDEQLFIIKHFLYKVNIQLLYSNNDIPWWSSYELEGISLFLFHITLAFHDWHSLALQIEEPNFKFTGLQQLY